MWHVPARERRSGGAQQFRRDRRTTMALTYTATAAQANIGSGQCPLTRSDRTHGAFFRSTATYGSGRRIAGTRITRGLPPTARLGNREGAITVSFVAAPGPPIQVISAQPYAAGLQSTYAVTPWAFG